MTEKLRRILSRRLQLCENGIVCGRVVILFIYNVGLLLALVVGAPVWLLRPRWREGLRERLGAGAARVGHALAGQAAGVGACCLRRRGGGRQPAGGRAGCAAGAGLGGDFDDDPNRPATGARAFRRRAVFLFPDRSAVGGAWGFSRAAAARAGAGRERAVAECAGGVRGPADAGGGGECAGLRSLAAADISGCGDGGGRFWRC